MTYHQARLARPLAVTAIALATLAGLCASPAGGAADRSQHPGACTPKFSEGAMHLCGPAFARLSAFRGFTFRNGTCKRLTVAGKPQLVLELGALTPGSATNGGLSYLKIEIDGPLSQPTSGSVISWHNGKRWAGIGQSFKGTAAGGTFVATGGYGLHPPAYGGRRATGSFRCSR
jgi:hypothetical protein